MRSIDANTLIGMAINRESNKLAEYEDLEEQGLIVRLPCRVGDTVYRISTKFHTKTKYIQKTKISRVAIDDDGIHLFCQCNPAAKCAYGKTVFPAREEAEAALAEQEKERAR